VQQIKFDFNLFMMSAILVQLPTSWRYDRENYKSQDMLVHKSGIYPEIPAFYQPTWETERFVYHDPDEVC